MKNGGTFAFAVRLVTVIAAIVSVGMAVFCFRELRSIRRAKADVPAVVFAEGSELEDALLEKQIREIVRDEYATYQSDMQNMLAVAGIVFTLFSIGVPLMNYMFLQKEHVQELRGMIKESEGLLAKQNEQYEKQDEQLKAQKKEFDTLVEMLGDEEIRIKALSDEQEALMQRTEAARGQAEKAEQHASEVEEKHGKRFNEIEEKQEQSLRELSKKIELLGTQAMPEGDPTVASGYITTGNQLYYDEKYAEAIEDYTKALNIYIKTSGPESVDLGVTYHNLANAYDGMEDYEKAIIYHNLALAISTTNAWYYIDRSNTFHRMKRYEEALEDSSKAIELDPENAEYYRSRAITLHATERYEEALEDRNKAIELDLENAEYYHGRAVTLHAMKRYEKALEDRRKAIELDPENAKYYDQRSITLHVMGRYEEAIADDNNAIELHPENADYYNSRAKTYRKLAETTEDPAQKAEYERLASEDEATAKKLREE